jgi:hypothetical protein
MAAILCSFIVIVHSRRVSRFIFAFSFISAGWIVIALSGVVSDHAAAPYGSFGGSAMRYGRAEYVRVLPIVVLVLKLRNGQRHVFLADFAERPIAPRLMSDQKPSMVCLCTALIDLTSM